ncbi:MAG TPA: inositol monophosphatase [Phycisphaerae bacterium]|nr:inositol monophosphatase [Phycisphaerae bacterium]
MALVNHPDSLRETAIALAEIGGQTAARFFGKVIATRKSDDSPVTEADHAAQEAILSALSHRHPSHSIVVEEDVLRPDRHAALTASEYCWIVDPIDGTRNFSRGVKVYATSIAVMHGGRPVAAAIYDATADIVFSASLGGGAYRGQERIRLRDRPIDRDTTVAVGSFRRRSVPQAVRGWLDHFLLRNFGSTSLHLAWVATGLVDAAYSAECKLWDIAAAALLIEEAGGIVSDHADQSIWPVDPGEYEGQDLPVLAGTKTMHGHLVTSLRVDTQPLPTGLG